jgi:uncharacterized protein
MMRRLLLTALLALPLAGQTTDTYYLVFLRPAADRKALPKEEGERIQAAHMANIHSLADRGVLVAAGPFGDNPTTISGVFVFKAASLDEAKRIAAADPTVVAHRNTVDGITWTGPKAVGEQYKRLHAADPKTPDDMGIHPFVLLRRTPAAADLARLRAERKVIAAGPISDSAEFRYLLVFARVPDDEARRLTPGDLQPEFHRWYCAAHVFPE